MSTKYSAKGREEVRLIQDLSSPQGHSVNDGIFHMPTEWQLIDDDLQLIHDAGRGCHLVKMDVKSAYRQLPIHPDDWHLFGFVCEDLLFIDTYLLHGHRLMLRCSSISSMLVAVTMH